MCVCEGENAAVLRVVRGRGTYPLLRQTTSALVLGVSEEFDDTLLVGSKTVARVSGVFFRVGAEGARARGEEHCAVLALAVGKKKSWETYPATSRAISRTNSVRLDRKPFLLEILGAGVLGVTSIARVSLHMLWLRCWASSCRASIVRGRRWTAGVGTYCVRR